MTYDYFIQFLTQHDTDLIPDSAVSFKHALQVGDVIQLDEGGEYHLIRLITHSPAGLTLHLSGKGQDIQDLLLSEPELIYQDKGPNGNLVEPLDVVIQWQKMAR